MKSLNNLNKYSKAKNINKYIYIESMAPVLLTKTKKIILLLFLFVISQFYVFGQCPTGTGVISGINPICQSSTNNSYTVTGFGGTITTYNWTVPSGVTITSGKNTNIITTSVSGSAVNGNITAFAINATPCTLASTAFNLTVNPVYTIPTSGISMQYLFSNNYTDGSGNGNTGVPQNTPTFTTDRFGNASSALLLNGSNQWVNNTSSVTIPTSFTLSIWIKTSVAGGWIVGRQNGGSHDRKIYLNNSGQAAFGIYNGAVTSIYSTSSVADNSWHNITATHSPSNGIRLYVDGVLQSSLATTSTDGNTGNWQIGNGSNWGGANGSTNTLFNGTIDDFYYYNRELAASEIAMVSGVSANQPSNCQSLIFSAPTFSGANYQWTGPNGFTSNSAKPTITGASSSNNGTYVFNSTVNGCVNQSLSTSVTLNTLPGYVTNITQQYLYSGNANDGASGANTGLPQNSPTLISDRFGNTNSAYQLNGTNQYITHTNSITIGTSFSLSIWFKTNTSVGGWIAGREAVQTGTGSNDRKIFMNDNGFVRFGVYNGAITSIVSNSALNDNRWHHAVATHSPTNGMRLYIDGILQTATNASTSTDGNTGYWRTGYGSNWGGATNGSTNAYFTGSIDDFQVFNSELTATDVALIYGITSNSPACTNLTLNVTTVNGASYAWSGPASFSSNVSNPTISGVTTSNSGTYTCVISTSGCLYPSLSANIQTNTLSTFTSSIIGSNTICQSQSGIIYSVNGINNGTSYIWSVPSGFTITSGSNTNIITVSISGTASSGTISLTGSNTFCGVGSTITFPVTVNNVYSVPTSGLYAQYLLNGNSTDNSGNNNNATTVGGPSFTTDRFGNSNSAIALNGSTQYLYSNNIITTAPTVFSLSLWFRTTTNQGGKLIGFGASQSGNSGSYDRHIYMTNAGNIIFGCYPGSIQTIQSSSAYNDGNWHHVVAILASSGMSLYMDGSLAGTNVTNTATNYNGYWRIGGDNINSWTNAPTSYYFNGSIDDVNIYNSAINQNDINLLFGIRSSTTPVCNNLILVGPTFAGVNYSWSGPSGFSSTIASPTISGVMTINSGLYSLTLTNASCVSPTLTNTIQTNASPGTIGTIVGLSQLCNFSTGNMYSISGVTNATSYNWTVPSGIIITSGNNSNVITVSVSGVFTGGNILVAAGNVCGTITSSAFAVSPYSLTSTLYSGLLVRYPFDNSNADISGNNNNAILQGTPSYITDRLGNVNSAISFNGSTQYGSSTTLITSAPSNYSFALWFNTTSSQGGKLIGYGSAQTGNSGSYDKHVYMTNNGNIIFGNWNGSIQTASTALTYNDGYWHHLAATYSTTNGLRIYVDGILVATNTANGASNYNGYWRIGGDNTAGWPSNPTSNYFNGALDELLIYNRELTSNEVQLLQGIGDNFPVCTGGDLILNTGTLSGAGYIWTGPNGFSSNIQNPTISGASGINSGTYNVTLSVSGCSISFSKIETINPSIVNTITGSQNVCTGFTPLNSLTGNVSPSFNYTYLWQSSTTNSITGYSTASGNNNFLNYGFSSTLPTSTWYTRSVIRGSCTVTSSPVAITMLSPATAANLVYPTGYWNVYAFGAQNNILNSTNTWSSYAGAYSINGLAFDSRTVASLTGYASTAGSTVGFPSNGMNYQGCQVNNVNYSLSLKTQGIVSVTGIYRVDLPYYDDATALYINGNQYFYDPTWFNNIPKTGIYVGPISPSDAIEVRINQGGGGGGGASLFTLTTPGTLSGGIISYSQSICPGNTPDSFLNVSLPGGGCNVASYKWQNSVSGGNWSDLSSSNSSAYTYSLSVSQTTNFRRVATDVCGQLGYSNTITVDNNVTPPGNPTVAGVGGWNAYFYYDRTFGTYAGGLSIPGLSFNTNPSIFPNGGIPSSNASYTGCNINATNISARFLQTGFTPATYQIDIPSHDDDVTVLVNGVQVFVHNGCCDAHTNVYTGTLGTTDVVEVRWQQGTGGSYIAATLTTVVSPPIVAGTIGQNAIVCSGDLPTQTFQTITSTTGCSIIGYQWQMSTVSGLAGYTNINNATTSGFNPNFNVFSNTWLRRIDFDGCGRSVTLAGIILSVSGIPGDTSVFPVNSWNTYGFNSNSYWTNYSGFATITGPSFRTDVNNLFLSNAQSPSYMVGYQGCSILPSTFSTRTKRRGFTSGRYDVQISHDDNGELWVNGVRVYNAGCCSNPTGVIWSGDLGANDRMELRQVQFPGGAYYGVILTPNTVPSGVTSGGLISGDQTICAGSVPTTNISNSVLGVGGGCYIYYAWESSTVAGFASSVVTLAGLGTSTSFTTSVLGSLTQTTYIRRAAIDACGTRLNSNTITISVSSPINAGSINTVSGVCAGTSPTSINELTPASGGLGTFSYIWQYSTDNSTFINIPTATGINYASPISISVPTYFRRNVFGGGCTTALGTSVLVNLNTNALITTQPQNTTVCGGSLALFNVGNSGVVTNYQWQISTGSGVFLNIIDNQVYSNNTFTGTNTNTLSVSGSNISLAGATFRNILTSGCGGTLTTTGALLTIGGPGILNQPVNANICTGLNAVYTPTLSGTVLSYQWQMSADNGNTYNNIPNNATFSGTNGLSLTVSGATTNSIMTGLRFLLNATSACNSFSSSTASGILTVTSTISGNTISVSNTTICSGLVTTIIGATPTGGGGIYNYQWQLSTTNSITGYANLTANGTSLNYTTSGITLNSWFQRVINSSSGCTSTSTGVGISPQQNTSIIGSSGNLSQCPGLNATFTVTANGTGAISYQWQENQGSGWNNISANATYSGVTSSLLSISGVSTSMNTWQYRCLVNSSCGAQQTSTARTLTILTPVSITGNPVGYNTCANSLAMTFGVTATGSATLTYAWQYSNNSGGGYATIGAITPYNWGSINTNTLSLSNGIPAGYNGYWYRAAVTNTCGTVYSNPAILTVNPALSNNFTSPDQTICPGIPSSIAGTNPIGGDGNYSYNWQSSSDNATWSNLSPTVTSINYIPLSSIAGTTYFRRQITSSDCPVNNSNSTTITVTPATAITTQPVSTAACVNTNASFSVIVTGASPSYQWQYATITSAGGNWANLNPVTLGITHSGTQSANLTIQNVPNSFNGYFYRCIVNGNCNPPQITSSGVILTVNPLPPAATSITGTPIVCQGQLGVSYLTTTLTNTVSYVWSLPAGTSISTGSGTNAVSLNYSTTASSGIVFVAGVNGCGTGTGSSLSVTVNPLPGAASAIAGSNPVCQGTNNVAYSISPITNVLTYNWNLPNGISLVSGGNSNSITVNYASTATSGIISIAGINACGTGTGNSLNITVNTTPGAAGTISGTNPTCQNITGIVLSVSGITNANSYQWGFPTGSVITAGANSNVATLSFSGGAISGIVTVRGINGGCIGSISPVFNLTVNSAISNNTISGNQIICINTAPQTFTGSNPSGGDGNYTYLWQSSTSSSTTGFGAATGTNNTLNYFAGNLNATTWFRRVANSNNCNSLISSPILISINSNSGTNWLGNNADWNNSVNWCGGTIPGISNDVFIGTANFMPNITSSGAIVRNLTLIGTSSLTLAASQVLTIAGDFINSGTFNAASGSTVLFNGAGNQSISGSNTFSNLSISKSSTTVGVLLAANQSITGTLTLGNNSKIVTTGFSLTLVSNTTTTGRLAQVPSSAAYVGNITVQRYIPAKRTFRFLGSPVVGATFNDWRNFGSTTPGIGIIVTGNGSGSDAGSNVPTITPYLETVSGIQNIGFNPVTSGMSTPLTNGVGYKVFVRGDRTINLSTNYTPTNTVIQVSGTPAIGNVSPPISFTNYGVLSQDGWNLVSNPYPSQIDWNTGITRNNVDNAIYIFDPISSNSAAVGDYFTYVNGVSAGINSARSNPSIIASSQAFFVKANAANPTLTFTENSKTGSSNTANFREESIPNLLYVTLNKSNTAISDNTAIRFDNNATNNFDSDYDAYKMKNSSLNISSFDASGTDLAINTFPEYGIEEKQINLNVQSATNGTYSLFINNLNSFENSVDVYLIDNYLQKTTLLSDNQSYTFDITSISGTQGSGRFKLVFKPQLGKVQVFIQPDTLTNSSWSLDNGNPQKSGTVMTNIPIGNHTISFAKVNNWKEPNQIQLNVIKNETKTIVSVYELLKQSNKSTSEFVVIQQNKNVDTVQITSQSTDINKELSLIHKLYPNPISEGQILHLQTPEDESYTIELISSKGQIIGSKSGISDGIIEINEMVNLTKGLYFIQYKSNNQNFVFKVLKQ